jgi:hypothetical protein
VYELLEADPVPDGVSVTGAGLDNAGSGVEDSIGPGVYATGVGFAETSNAAESVIGLAP